jgi:hypothetical protein
VTLPERLTADETAAMLGDGVEARHVRARIHRGTLAATKHGDDWLIAKQTIEDALAGAPPCEACGSPSTAYLIVKYPHHDRVEFELCAAHGSEAVLSYGRQGQVLEVVSYPYQSEGWIKVDPR